MLDTALLERLNDERGRKIFQGDKANVGNALLLLLQLMWYRDWAHMLHKKRSCGDLVVGGVITPILLAAGVPLQTAPYQPEWLDIPNLIKQHILDRKRIQGGHLYQFTHPSAGPSRIKLPSEHFTQISRTGGIEFCPPLEALYNQDEEVPTQTTRVAEEEQQEDESYFFDEEPPARTLKEANRRINQLQRLGKWQHKTMSVLKDTVKDLSDSVKSMKKQIKGLKGKKSSRTPSGPQLKRSGSFSFRPRQTTSADPPRHSAVEPRQRKRRATQEWEQGTSSVSALGIQTESRAQRLHSATPLGRLTELSLNTRSSSARELGYTPELETSRPRYTDSFFQH